MLKTWVKRILLGLIAVIALAALGVSGFVWMQVRAFDESVAKVYEVPLPKVARSSDPEVLARGKHLAESLGGCHACHGENLGGGKASEMGPIMKLVSANLTTGKNGKGADYSDAELARLIKHGIRRDGTSVRFMPSQDFSWWPEEDVTALISYLRTVPPVDSPPSLTEIKVLAKVLDRLDKLPLDVGRRLDHANLPQGPAPAATAAYGQYLSTLCHGCHGKQLSGGPIPGAPPEVPVPLNLTPHETGLKTWAYADFVKLMREGMRKNGKALNPFMPIETTKNYSELELQALWAYLQTTTPLPFGQR